MAKSQGAEGLEKLLVIKKILPELSRNTRFVEMFIAEARIAVGLNHPNIVQIYDFGKVDGDFFLAMEYVDGWDLSDLAEASRAESSPTISIGDAVFVGLEVARGLDYAHRRSDEFGESLELVHRDISPQNLLASRDGTIKIVDFGIAKAANFEEESPHVVKGKFCYMSPEQAAGRAVDQRSDLFSLGVVLFELVCGRQLFRQTTSEQTLSLVKSAVVPDIASLNEDIPPELEHLLYKLLAQDPEDRYPSARELQQELSRILYGIGEVHDSYTLSEYIAELEPWLEGERGPHEPRASGSTDTIRTNVIQTAARMATTRERGNTVEMTMSRTPVTPALEVVGGVGGGGAGEGLTQVQARSRKEAVVIAGELDGLLSLRGEIGQDRWLQVFQEYTRMVDSIAFKNDGVAHRVNESGFVLLLGVPVSSENDAARAARVAMDLQDAMAGINLSLETPIKLSVGVAIADVILEQELGSDGRRRFDWTFHDGSHEFAEQVARAGMSKEILLGGQIWRRIRRDYNCEQINGLELGGQGGEEVTQAWRLVGPKGWRDRLKEIQHAYGAFHGRSLELRQLRRAYRRTLLEGVSSAMVIMGEQGVGKSTLIEEFLSGLDPRDVRVIRGVTNPFDQDVPLGNLGALLAELLRLGPREELRQVRATIETRIQALFPDEPPDEREMMAHSIGAIFAIRFPGSLFDELGGEERRKRISLSLRKLLRRFAEKKPFVLSIDDAHYIDSMTLEIMGQLFDSRQDAPMFLVLALPRAAMQPQQERWDQVIEARYVHVEELQELGPGESRALARDLLRLHRIEDDELVEDILRRAGGNPFYIKEVIEVLRDRGALKDPGTRRQLKLDMEGGWLPTSVEGAISARIDRLELTHKAMLQRAALLWTPFTGEDVEQVLGLEELGLLEELVEQGFLERVDEEHRGPGQGTWDPGAVEPGRRHYRFLNALTQEAAARTLLGEEASELHGRIAERLMGSERERNVTDNAQIARHLDGAGRIEEAVEYYFDAAEEAFEQFGASESLRLCEKVLERVGPEHATGLEALKLKEQALRGLGMQAEHKATLDELAAQVERRDDPEEQARVWLRLARYHYDQAEFRQSGAFIEQAREVAREHGLDTQLAQSWHYEAYLRLDQGRREEALELVHRAIAGFEGTEGEDAERGLISCYNTQGVIRRRTGRHEEALESYQQALDLLGEGGADQLVRYLLINMGLALVYVGRYTDGLECYQRALAQAKKLGHRRDEAAVLINIGHAYQVLGDDQRAISHIQRGLYLARKASANYILADGEISLGVCYAERGEAAKAERVLSEGLRLAESIPHIYLAVHAMLALARLKLETAQHQDARVAIFQAEDSLERCEKAGMRWGVTCARMLLARAYKVLGDRERAIDEIREALALLEDGEEYAREEVLYWASQILQDEEERLAAIREARELVLARVEGIDDEELHKSFLERDLHQKILQAARAMD